MQKLLRGISEFRKKSLERYRKEFAHLATEQKPDALFIACSDSRVVPNLFASTDPGDLFVMRNVGNMVPCCKHDGHSDSDESEASAIEFALENLNVKDIIVCGHSQCGAMQAILEGREKLPLPNLKAWLRHGEQGLKKIENFPGSVDEKVNELSRQNTLVQLEHLKSYPLVQKRLENKTLKLHAWWFDLKTADVYRYDSEKNEFLVIE